MVPTVLILNNIVTLAAIYKVHSDFVLLKTEN